jgi:hypothetical protein
VNRSVHSREGGVSGGTIAKEEKHVKVWKRGRDAQNRMKAVELKRMGILQGLSD